jgi:hypothetical protein
MWTEGEEVRNAVRELKLPIIAFPQNEAALIRTRVYQKFTTRSRYSYPLWEHLASTSRVIYDFAWQWFTSLLKEREVVLFFEEDNDKSVFSIPNGSAIVSIMENCPGMTFYVTNLEADYLYSYHNDHSVFSVSGTEERKRFKEFTKSNQIIVEIHEYNHGN